MSQLLSQGKVEGDQKPTPPLSAITVRLGGDKNSGKIIEWGSKNLIKRLSKRREDLAQDKEISGPKSRDELVKNKEISGAPFFVMEIPALNRSYLGYKKLEKIMLIPISGVKPTERTERIERLNSQWRKFLRHSPRKHRKWITNHGSQSMKLARDIPQ